MIWDGELKDYIVLLEKADYIGCDTENSGSVRGAELWDGSAYLTGISTCIREGGFCSSTELLSFYFSIRHPDSDIDGTILERLKDVLRTKQLGFHNINIDLPALETLGVEPNPELPPWDTTTAMHMVNEEFPSKKLDWLAKFVLKKEKKVNEKLERWIKLLGWSEIPTKLIFEYGAVDAELQYELMEVAYRSMQP